MGPARSLNQLGAGKGHQETQAAWTRQEAWDEADSGSWSARLGPEASRLAQCALSARKRPKLLSHSTPPTQIHERDSSKLLPVRNGIGKPGVTVTVCPSGSLSCVGGFRVENYCSFFFLLSLLLSFSLKVHLCV